MLTLIFLITVVTCFQNAILVDVIIFTISNFLVTILNRYNKHNYKKRIFFMEHITHNFYRYVM